MAFIFIDIDTQHDFMDPDGALYVPGAEKLVGNLRRLYRLAARYRIPVIATMDAHVENDPEFAEYSFPAHCVRGTRGQKKLDVTMMSRCEIVPRDGSVDLKKLPKQLIIEKVAFSVFTNPHAANLILDVVPKLAGIRTDETEYVVFGVATEYCVLATVLGLTERGAKVWLVTDAIAAVDPAAGEKALQDMTEAGVRLISSIRVEKMITGTGADEFTGM